MALVRLAGNSKFWYPLDMQLLGGEVVTLDMPGEDGSETTMAYGGQVWWPGRSGSKNIETAYFRYQGNSVAGGEVLNLRVSLQATENSAFGPDGEDQVIVLPAAETGGGWTAATFESPRTVNFGERLALAFDISSSAWDGDQLSFSAFKPAPTGYGSANPWIMYDEAEGLNKCNGLLPIMLFGFDDGSFGMLDGAAPILGTNTSVFDASNSPDEYGISFRLPWTVAVDALCMFGSTRGAESTVLNLTHDGTPVGAVHIDEAETSPSSTEGLIFMPLEEEITLTKDLDTIISVAPGATASPAFLSNLLLESDAPLMFGDSQTGRVSRTDGGAWSSVDQFTLPRLGMRVCAVNVGSISTAKPWLYYFRQHSGGAA